MRANLITSSHAAMHYTSMLKLTTRTMHARNKLLRAHKHAKQRSDFTLLTDFNLQRRILREIPTTVDSSCRSLPTALLQNTAVDCIRRKKTMISSSWPELGPVELECVRISSQAARQPCTTHLCSNGQGGQGMPDTSYYAYISVASRDQILPY